MATVLNQHLYQAVPDQQPFLRLHVAQRHPPAVPLHTHRAIINFEPYMHNTNNSLGMTKPCHQHLMA